MNNAIHFDQRYETLWNVYRLGSYSAVGEVLALTPSAVAQQIHSLEKELNTKLYTRSGDRLVPTKECKLILDYVKQVKIISSRLKNDLDSSDQISKHISIGLTHSVENIMLTRVFSHYQNENESVQITVRSESAEILCDLLRANSLDIAILDGDFPRKEFNSILLDTDHLVIAVPKDSKYKKRGFITLNELKNENLILRLDGSNTRRLFEAHLARIGHSISELNVMLEIDNVNTIKRLVCAGYGVSVLSANSCRADEEKGTLATVRLQDMEMSRSIHIIYRPECNYDALLMRLQQLYNQIDNVGAEQ